MHKKLIGVIGINHKTAPVEIRELIAFSDWQIHDFLNSLKQETGINGAIVLSTCNRSEFYFDLEDLEKDEAFEKIFKLIADAKSLEPTLKKHFYFHANINAVNHLFRVASGLDSMALGEDQIIGQVKNAYHISVENKFASSIISRLFHKAFEAGKRVRTETKINEGASSVSYAAVTLAAQHCPDLRKQQILLIGAGQTGELTIQCLSKKGCNNILIANRTLSNAEKLATRYNAQALALDDIDQYLKTCDIVLVSTAADQPLINKQRLSEAMKKRDKKSLLLIDLSVPRNITTDVEEIENVNLFDVDDLNEVVMQTFEHRKTEIEKAYTILEEVETNFNEWFTSLNLNPTIRQIKANFRKINQLEFDDYKKNKPEIDYQKIWEYGDHISEKFSGLLIRNLKTLTDNGKKIEYLSMINELFELIQENETSHEN